MAESEKRIRILYVCPLAHWAGHQPHAAIKESSALVKAGVEVSLCTFQGILDQKEPQTILHRTVVSSWAGFPLGILTHLLRVSVKTKPTKGLAWFLEVAATLFLAVRLRKTFKYDVIYLRDGDPFIFIPFVLGLVFKHYRWAISLIGAEMVISPRSLPASLFYKFVNVPMWKPIYRRSLSKNRFAFLCQNNYIKDYFETNFLGGILSGSITVVPLGAEKATNYMSQKEARRYLGLPEDKVIFLHFGSLHSTKDIETVLAAIRDVPDVLFVHAGAVTLSVNPIDSVQRHGLQNRVIIKDYYIPEAEKQHYLSAADAMILSYKRDSQQTTSMLWEAAKFKLPTIASDNGELGELVKRYKIGLVFKAEDAASLKGAISNFLNSSQSEIETMRNNCEKFCDEFSPDEWVKNCVRIFRELCEH